MVIFIKEDKIFNSISEEEKQQIQLQSEQKFKAAFQKINRWEYEKIMNELKDAPEVKSSQEYFDGVLNEYLAILDKSHNKDNN